MMRPKTPLTRVIIAAVVVLSGLEFSAQGVQAIPADREGAAGVGERQGQVSYDVEGRIGSIGTTLNFRQEGHDGQGLRRFIGRYSIDRVGPFVDLQDGKYNGVDMRMLESRTGFFRFAQEGLYVEVEFFSHDARELLGRITGMLHTHEPHHEHYEIVSTDFTWTAPGN